MRRRVHRHGLATRVYEQRRRVHRPAGAVSVNFPPSAQHHFYIDISWQTSDSDNERWQQRCMVWYGYKVARDTGGVSFYGHVWFKKNMNIKNSSHSVTRHFIIRHELNFAMKHECKNLPWGSEELF